MVFSILLYLLDQNRCRIMRKLCESNFYREFPLSTLCLTLGKFLHCCNQYSSLGSSSGPIELFDALKHFQAPFPDAAFAINMSEEFLADGAYSDCAFPPETRPPEGMRSSYGFQTQLLPTSVYLGKTFFA